MEEYERAVKMTVDFDDRDDTNISANSLVELLGGEAKAKIWIASCRSSVRIFSTEIRMMDLMKRGGFSVVRTCGAYSFLVRTGIGEDLLDAGTNSAGGGNANNSQKSSKKVSNLFSSLRVGEGGRRGGVDNSDRDGGDKSGRGNNASNPPLTVGALNQGKQLYKILVVNQRGDDLSLASHKLDYVVILARSNSSKVKHMKAEVCECWGVTPEKQFYRKAVYNNDHFVEHNFITGRYEPQEQNNTLDARAEPFDLTDDDTHCDPT